MTPSTSTPPNTPPRVTNTPPESKLIWCDLGDVNSVGTANSTDYAMIRRYLLGLIEKLPYQEMSNIKIPVADLNGDGSINSTDYALMRRYILGTLTEFPVEYDINGKIIKN